MNTARLLTTPGLEKLFTRVPPPYMFVSPSGKRIAARAAKYFLDFVEGLTQAYNEKYHTSYDPAQLMTILLDQDVRPENLFSEYAGLAQQGRALISADWVGQKGFNDGWKVLTPAFSKWFLWNIVPRPYKIDQFSEYRGAAWLKALLVSHPKGQMWMDSFVQQLRQLLFPQAPPVETQQQ